MSENSLTRKDSTALCCGKYITFLTYDGVSLDLAVCNVYKNAKFVIT